MCDYELWGMRLVRVIWNILPSPPVLTNTEWLIFKKFKTVCRQSRIFSLWLLNLSTKYFNFNAHFECIKTLVIGYRKWNSIGPSLSSKLRFRSRTKDIVMHIYKNRQKHVWLKFDLRIINFHFRKTVFWNLFCFQTRTAFSDCDWFRSSPSRSKSGLWSKRRNDSKFKIKNW